MNNCSSFLEAARREKLDLFPRAERSSGRTSVHYPLDISRYFFWFALLFALLYVARMFDVGFFVGDEGVATLDAWRIALGQIPHRDFFEIIPPASFLPLALLFKLFSVSVFIERALVALLGLTLILSVDGLARLLTKDYWCRSAAILMLASFGVAYWPVTSHHWFADIFSLWALILLLMGIRSASPVRFGVSAGIFTALTCFSLQDQGTFLLLGLCALFFPFLKDKKRRVAILLSWCSGGLVVAACFAAYLLPRVSPATLFYQWVVFPLTRYKGNPGNASSLLSGWEAVMSFLTQRDFSHAFLDWLLLLVLWGFIFLLPWISMAAIALAGWKGNRPRLEIGLLGAGWVAFFGTCARRWAFTNLVWAAPMFLVLAAWGFAQWRSSAHRAARVTANTILVAVTSAAISYASFEMAQAGPRSRAEVHSRAGTVFSLVPEEASLLQNVVDGVERHVPEGEPLFVGSFFPLVNFLTLTPPATRYDFFQFPVYNTEAQAREVRDTLEERKVRFALLPVQSLPGDWLRSYFAERFRPVWGNGVVVLMERIQEAGPSKLGGSNQKDLHPPVDGKPKGPFGGRAKGAAQ